MTLAEKLVEELNCEEVFRLHIGGLDIPIMESVVVTWIVMAVLILIAIFLTTGLKTQNISKKQAFAELIYEKLNAIVGNDMMRKPISVDYILLNKSCHLF